MAAELEFIKVNVLGLNELEQNLNLLSEEMAKKIMLKATREAWKDMRDKLKERAPVGATPLTKPSWFKGERTLHLKDGLVVAGKIKSNGVKGAEVQMIVGLRRLPSQLSVWYGRYQEYGAPVAHIPARPWMRPVFDGNVASSIDKVGNGIGIGIEKTKARMKKTGETL